MVDAVKDIGEDELEDMDLEQFPDIGNEEDFEEMNTCSSTDLGGTYYIEGC